jgi:hypothetical protein
MKEVSWKCAAVHGALMNMDWDYATPMPWLPTVKEDLSPYTEVVLPPIS